MQTKNFFVSRQRLRQEWNRDILNLLTPQKQNKSVSRFPNHRRDSYIPSENSVYEIYERKTHPKLCLLQGRNQYADR